MRRFKVDLRRFAEAGFLSYALCGVALDDAALRRQAYEVVASVLALLERDTFRDREQLQLVLKSLRRSVTSPYQQVPSLFAQFLAQSVLVMLRAEHFLYPAVNKFLLARPTLDLLDVPLLYECMSSSGMHFRRERLWLLALLRGGLASEQVQ